MRAPGALAGCLAAAALLAGCGGSKQPTTTAPTTISAAANTAYERAYTECASTRLVDLAHKYNVKQDRSAIATAVAKFWARQVGGAPDAVAAARAGCEDGYALETK